MVNVNTSIYSSYGSFYGTNEHITESALTTVAGASPLTDTGDRTVSKTDTVTLSPAVEWAQRRESLGLNPTGKITKGDIETVVDIDMQEIKDQLATLMVHLGIDENQQISLSLDENGDIVVTEDFPGSSELEEMMNQDEAFTVTFNRLATNNQLLDYTENIQTRVAGEGMRSQMNTNADWSDLNHIASVYNAFKSGDDPLELLTRISRQENPFLLIYNPAAGDS